MLGTQVGGANRTCCPGRAWGGVAGGAGHVTSTLMCLGVPVGALGACEAGVRGWRRGTHRAVRGQVAWAWCGDTLGR